MGARCHPRRELRNIDGTAHLFQLARLGQLVGHGEHIDGFLRHAEVTDGRIDHLVARFIETLREEHLTHHGVGILVDEEGAQDGFLNVECLWLQVSVGIVHGLLIVASAISLFCHRVFLFKFRFCSTFL